MSGSAATEKQGRGGVGAVGVLLLLAFCLCQVPAFALAKTAPEDQANGRAKTWTYAMRGNPGYGEGDPVVAARMRQFGAGMGLIGVGFVPWIGDAVGGGMDAYTAADPNASGFARWMSGASLGVNAATAGAAPNWSPLRRGWGNLADAFTRSAARRTTALSPYRVTTAGEAFSHYGYAENAASFEGGLRPGGFATSAGNLSGVEAQSGLALRHSAPPNAVYTITPEAGIWIKANPVTRPQFGQPGGLPEYQFPGGTGPGTVSEPRLIP